MQIFDIRAHDSSARVADIRAGPAAEHTTQTATATRGGAEERERLVLEGDLAPLQGLKCACSCSRVKRFPEHIVPIGHFENPTEREMCS